MANKTSKVMDSGMLVSLVTKLAEAAKGTAYTDSRGRARSNSGVWVNTVYPRGTALNDLLRGQGFDPIESVQAAVKAGKLVTRPAGGHSIAVAVPQAVKDVKPAVTDLGAKNAAVGAAFFSKTAKPAVKEAKLPWGKDTPPVQTAKATVPAVAKVTPTGMVPPVVS